MSGSKISRNIIISVLCIMLVLGLFVSQTETSHGALTAYLDVSLSGDGTDIITAKMVSYQKVDNTSINMYLQSKETGGVWKTVESKKNVDFKSVKSVKLEKSTGNNTKFWRIKLTGKLLGGDVNYKTYAKLYNRKAKAYPKYKEVYSGKKCKVPASNLKVNKQERDGHFRSNYIENFESKYPKAKVHQ